MMQVLLQLRMMRQLRTMRQLCILRVLRVLGLRKAHLAELGLGLLLNIPYLPL
jgi:hypothetical protein